DGGAFGVETLAENFDLAGGGVQQARQTADGGALARAVRTEEAEHGARLDRERQAFDGSYLAVLLDQVSNSYGVHSVSPFLRRWRAVFPAAPAAWLPRVRAMRSKKPRPAGPRGTPSTIYPAR